LHCTRCHRQLVKVIDHSAMHVIWPVLPVRSILAMGRAHSARVYTEHMYMAMAICMAQSAPAVLCIVSLVVLQTTTE
jgi:hypothetical protein